MTKRVILLILFLAAIFPLASAADITLSINSYANKSINVQFLNPEGSNPISFGSISDKINSEGSLSLNFSSDATEYDLSVFVFEGSTTHVHEKFTDVEAQGSYCLVLLQGATTIIDDCKFDSLGSPVMLGESSTQEEIETIENITEDSNETEENETIIENTTEKLDEENEEELIVQDVEEETEKSRITGSVIKDIFSNKITYYGLGVVVLILIVYFSFKELKKIKISPKNIKIRKLSEMNKEKRGNKVEDYEKMIKDARKTIEDAEAEIKKLKSQDKIEEAKKKLIEDEKELMQLRKEKQESPDDKKE